MRATELSADEDSAVVERVDQAAHVLSVTRRLVFRAIELFVYKTLGQEPEDEIPDQEQGVITKKDMKMQPRWIHWI